MTAVVPRADEPAVPGDGAWDAASYHAVFGWDIDYRDNVVLLVLGQGLVALVAPVPVGTEALARLRHFGADGPVFAVDGLRPHWVFLAEADEYILPAARLPAGVEILGCGQALPIPSAEVSSGRRWIVAPDDRRRWLPTLSAVLLGIRGSR
jgi:hypothetical protein